MSEKKPGRGRKKVPVPKGVRECFLGIGRAQGKLWLPRFHDWEADPRPLAECIEAWREHYGWSLTHAARVLGETKPAAAYRRNRWRAGKARAASAETTREFMTRRLMCAHDMVQAYESRIRRLADDIARLERSRGAVPIHTLGRSVSARATHGPART